ncbi:hypothetical protein B0T16DRAFT_459085 [Cercophora newfieldiana]|uniref:Uncharacterized protein n=1 Tax=Cercophora newfieldiana TaxID=92897 RepID=A0AA39XZB1_9PEZI|nr:hypothetical protein B0T16DRAFT_459085 [Cercophora newfieldiana]
MDKASKPNVEVDWSGPNSPLNRIENLQNPGASEITAAVQMLKQAARDLSKKEALFASARIDFDRKSAWTEANIQAAEFHHPAGRVGQFSSGPSVPARSHAFAKSFTRKSVVDQNKIMTCFQRTEDKIIAHFQAFLKDLDESFQNLVREVGQVTDSHTPVMERINTQIETTQKRLHKAAVNLEKYVAQDTKTLRITTTNEIATVQVPVAVNPESEITPSDVNQAILKLSNKTHSEFKSLRADLTTLRTPLLTIRDDLRQELALSRQKCSELQRKLDSLGLKQLEEDFRGVVVKMLSSNFSLVGNPTPSVREVVPLLGNVQMRGTLNETVKEYINTVKNARSGWHCLRMLRRYGLPGSRVRGACECGGGAKGEGDTPCVLVTLGEGIPFQFAYGPMPPFP